MMPVRVNSSGPRTVSSRQPAEVLAPAGSSAACCCGQTTDSSSGVLVTETSPLACSSSVGSSTSGDSRDTAYVSGRTSTSIRFTSALGDQWAGGDLGAVGERGDLEVAEHVRRGLLQLAQALHGQRADLH